MIVNFRHVALLTGNCVAQMLPQVFVQTLEFYAWQNILLVPVGVFRPTTCAIKVIVHMTTVAVIDSVK